MVLVEYSKPAAYIYFNFCAFSFTCMANKREGVLIKVTANLTCH